MRRWQKKGTSHAGLILEANAFNKFLLTFIRPNPQEMKPVLSYLLCACAAIAAIHFTAPGWAWVATIVLSFLWPLSIRHDHPLKWTKILLMMLACLLLAVGDWLVLPYRVESVNPVMLPFVLLFGWPLVNRLRRANTHSASPVFHLLMGVVLLLAFASFRALAGLELSLAVAATFTLAYAWALTGLAPRRWMTWLVMVPYVLLQFPTMLLEGGKVNYVHFVGIELPVLLAVFAAGWWMGRRRVVVA
jgi:hypothetical protein